MWYGQPPTRIIEGLLFFIAILFLAKNIKKLDSRNKEVSHSTNLQLSWLQSALPFQISKLSKFSNISVVDSEVTDKASKAKRIRPAELMNRTLPVDRTRVPMVMHQSWKKDRLPTRMHDWAMSCRQTNPSWEYVLWTDEDNRSLVEKYAPWFLEGYGNLRSEIYRADAARYIYMHVFGGVYMDLDTECIKSYDTLFTLYNITTAPYLSLNQTLPINTSQRTTRSAFLGRMGSDEESSHSIPNAWMASTPGQPFWLLILEKINAHSQDGSQPEFVTGPVSLYDEINEYKLKYHDRGASLDEHYSLSDWGYLYPAQNQEVLNILPFWMVYPFSWQRDGDAYQNYCLVGRDAFNSTRCKEVLALEAWGSWSITYWSHSWSAGGDNDASKLEKTSSEDASKDHEAFSEGETRGKKEELKDVMSEEYEKPSLSQHQQPGIENPNILDLPFELSSSLPLSSTLSSSPAQTGPAILVPGKNPNLRDPDREYFEKTNHLTPAEITAKDSGGNAIGERLKQHGGENKNGEDGENGEKGAIPFDKEEVPEFAREALVEADV